MSLMPRAGRSAPSLIALAFLIGVTFVMSAGPSAAQGDAGAGDAGTGGGNATAGSLPPLGAAKTSRTITIGASDDPAVCKGGKVPCWDTDLVFAKPGEVVTLIADLRDTATPHNIQMDGVDDPVYVPDDGDKTTDESETIILATFEVPEDFDGKVFYICTLHKPQMKGEIVTHSEYLAALAGAGGHIEVPHLGVNFLAYWVGLIAFALLFIVYGITFFLFKYNETPAATDHWDRTGAGAPEVRKRMPGGNALLLSVVLAIVVLAAIIWLARR